MSSGRLPPGKVPWDVVTRHLGDRLPDEVLLGPGAGEDAALVRLGDETWAIASDPISFGAPDAGRLAVIVNANDVAVRGARPRFFLAVVLIAPGEAEPSHIGKILGDVRTTCEGLGVVLLGGHTEVTPGIEHSIVVGTMLGRVEHRPIRTGGLEPGDRIGLVGRAGLEGSAILLDRYRDQLERIHGREAFADLERLLSEDWLLIVPAALAAASCPGVHSLHDVTEGGARSSRGRARRLRVGRRFLLRSPGRAGGRNPADLPRGPQPTVGPAPAGPVLSRSELPTPRPRPHGLVLVTSVERAAVAITGCRVRILSFGGVEGM